MRTQFLTFEEMDAALCKWLPESVECSAFPDPIDGNGYAPILTIVRHGEPGDVITVKDRFATYGEAVTAAYRIAMAHYQSIRWIVLREA